MTSLKLRLAPGVVACAGAFSAYAAEPDWLDEIVVTATLRDESLRDVPASVTVLPEKTLQQSGVQHFEDVLSLVPNLNWAGATSRPRYFQLRGIGELEQYQGAPNPSVGFLIDDIDFSGIGMPATLFDVQQVEVLRGPQGTRYGANALAGLIKFKTLDPDPELTARTELTLGEDDTRALGAAVSGPLGGDALGLRLSLQDYRADGFRHNAYLGRDDTNRRDELTARGKLHWAPSAATTVDVTALYADLANGYDAFAIDNSYTTLSDKPGMDSQRSLAGALRVDHHFADSVDLLALATFAHSDMEQSYDGDWGNDVDWGAFAPNDYTSRTLRRHETATAELRLGSANGTDRAEAFGERSWVAGLYYLKLDEDNDGLDVYNGEVLTALTSTYGADTLAAYGQVRWPLADRFALTGGFRLERWSADYRDSDAEHFEPADTMWGGEIALNYQVDDARTAYFALSRGYKTGGFNIGPGVPDDRRRFGPETLANIELGLKGGWLAGRVTGDASLFYSRRQNQQVSTSIQPDPANPLFVFYTDNARGENYGLESSWRWAVTERWDLGATLGLLSTRYIDYLFGDRDLDGREQASAPEYEYSVSIGYQHPRGWLAHLDVAGKDNFYFDASNDEQSHPYTLVNLRFGYAAERWSATVWGRNVFDVRYAVRGFFFGNEPPDFPDKLYLRLGDPRQWGVTVDYRF
ncbi:MAG TPA: TonB-dependent receptor [Steroidobacteraceae bacterium]|nr:TonB-dependent receptor [Steroidobacteraceae bacterium]